MSIHVYFTMNFVSNCFFVFLAAPFPFDVFNNYYMRSIFFLSLFHPHSFERFFFYFSFFQFFLSLLCILLWTNKLFCFQFEYTHYTHIHWMKETQMQKLFVSFPLKLYSSETFTIQKKKSFESRPAFHGKWIRKSSWVLFFSRTQIVKATKHEHLEASVVHSNWWGKFWFSMFQVNTKQLRQTSQPKI